METTHANETKSPGDLSAGLLTKDEIAKLCQVTTRCVDNWMKEKKIPFLKIKTVCRFRWPAVEAALAKFERKSVS